MIQRETSQPLVRPPECLEFLRTDEGPFPGQAHTRPEFGEHGAPRGYIVAPPSYSYGVGDIPHGVNRPEVNPAELGGLFEVPLALGDIHLVTRPDLAIYQQPARML